MTIKAEQFSPELQKKLVEGAQAHVKPLTEPDEFERNLHIAVERHEKTRQELIDEEAGPSEDA